MATYANRTCTQCGWKSIQPNMKQVSVEYKSGSSEAGLSKRAIAGSLLGGKNASKQVNNWISGNSKRQYKRTKKVWVCDTVGCGVKVKESLPKQFAAILFQGIIMVALLFAAALIFA